jgi:hypothetical protein
MQNLAVTNARSRRGRPPEVVALIDAIALISELVYGRPQPWTKVSACTGLRRQLPWQWVTYRTFPTWEDLKKFFQILEVLGDRAPRERERIEKLWKAARDVRESGSRTTAVKPVIRTTTRREFVRRVVTATAATTAATVTVTAATELLPHIERLLNRAPDTHADGPPRRYAWVIAPTSPVYINVGDAKPLKHKFGGDRVQLVEMDSELDNAGTAFLAVALPARGESPTGYGWMPAADLRPI